LIGAPNAGKSTLISRISAAKPKVADYHFTTLVPSLGVVDMGIEGSFVVADIPGLIKGASQGAGLGLQFLRHVSRTRILLHLLSLGPDEDESPLERYRAIRAELNAFNSELGERKEIILFTKTDLVQKDDISLLTEQFKEELQVEEVLSASSITGDGLSNLKHHLWLTLQREVS